MRTLVNTITGRKDFPIFNATNEKIRGWIENNLDEFNLNEPHSCDVRLFGDTISIVGDEDVREFDIVNVKVIDFEFVCDR